MLKQSASIKVGCKTYNVSNSWNSLFLCGDVTQRRQTALSVYEQLRADKYRDNVEVRLLSQSPDGYDGGIAQGFDVEIIEENLKEMERRCDLIANCGLKNYIQYNQRNADKALKLRVLIIDGAEDVMNNPKYSGFAEALFQLVKKSRAAGIHIISLINELPVENEDFFKYHGTPVHVMRKGFFMKEVTNDIIKELYMLGYTPTINLSYDSDQETVWIGINTEINGVHLSFSFNYDSHSVKYALLFPIDEAIDFNTEMEVYRTLRTDGSNCYDSFSDDYYDEHLALIGSRWASQVTPLFIQRMVEEIFSLKVVEKLKNLQKT